MFFWEIQHALSYILACLVAYLEVKTSHFSNYSNGKKIILCKGCQYLYSYFNCTLLFASFFSRSGKRLLLQLPHQLHLSGLPSDFWNTTGRLRKALWCVSVQCGWVAEAVVLALPWASSLRSSLASEGLGNSVWPTLGGRPFLRREPEPSLSPAACWRSALGGRPLRPSMALMRGMTSSSLSGHHCRPWGGRDTSKRTNQIAAGRSVKRLLHNITPSLILSDDIKVQTGEVIIYKDISAKKKKKERDFFSKQF